MPWTLNRPRYSASGSSASTKSHGWSGMIQDTRGRARLKIEGSLFAGPGIDRLRPCAHPPRLYWFAVCACLNGTDEWQAQRAPCELSFGGARAGRVVAAGAAYRVCRRPAHALRPAAKTESYGSRCSELPMMRMVARQSS
jgi:hypothetical protein